MQNDLKTSNSYRKILRVALPMSVAIMIPQLSILTNTIFLGNYFSSDGVVHGQEALAVAGVAGIYYFTFVMITFGLASGILMLMSRKAGANDAKGVGFIFRAGFQLGLGLTVFLLLASLIFSDYFFAFSLQNLLVQSLAQNFIAIRIWGLPFLFMAHLGNMLFIATDKTKYMLYGTLAETLITIALDYMLIFGNLGFPEMGVAGAAIASVVAELAFFVVVFGIIFYNKFFRQFQISLWAKVGWAKLKEFFVVSSPLMVQFFLGIGSWEVFFIFVEHLGPNELGASQIIRSVYGIMGIIVWALANTANSMVSNLAGQKMYHEILPVTHKIIKLSLGYVTLVASVLFIFSEQFIKIYTSNPVLINLATPTLYVVLIAAFIFSFSTIYFNAMLGLGNTKRNLLYEAAAISMYLLYAYIVVERLRSTLWLSWTSEFIYWSVLLVLSAWYMNSKKWMPEKK